MLGNRQMKKKETLVCVNQYGREGALAKIRDLDHQVVVAFIALDGDHLTLHKQEDTERLLTNYWSKNKPQSKADPIKVEIAKCHGYKNPERHSKYFMHQELVRDRLMSPCLFEAKGDAGGNRVPVPFFGLRLSSANYRYPVPTKYQKMPRVVLSVDSDPFYLSFYFTRDFGEFRDVSLVPIRTSLGYLSLSADTEKPFSFGISSSGEDGI
jgi:hypothetical protein